MEKLKYKFLLAFSNPLQRLYIQRQFDPGSAYRKPPVVLKSVPEAGCDTYTGVNRTNNMRSKDENRPMAEKISWT
jgi:hypothetical protein